ncbi:unnamed protein product [Linum trigynum]|uniref:Uncharacterized protein n=1 Tax=Linum trigynum TaxID=586398 RepID=A0AAV2GRT3_9ROSI
MPSKSGATKGFAPQMVMDPEEVIVEDVTKDENLGVAVKRLAAIQVQKRAVRKAEMDKLWQAMNKMMKVLEEAHGKPLDEGCE